MGQSTAIEFGEKELSALNTRADWLSQRGYTGAATPDLVRGSGHRAFAKAWPSALAALAEQLPAILLDSLREQWARVAGTEMDIASIERRLASTLRSSQACREVAAIPGVGLLTATAAVATIGDPKTFKAGRQFAAWLGLVPRQTGTGGRIRQLGLSRRGDPHLRTLLIHGARAIVARGKHSPWLESLLRRRPYSVAVAALANKRARTIWAVLARGKPFDSTQWHCA